jgi:hypothetical protein
MLVFHHKPEVKWIPSGDLRIGKFMRLNVSVKTIRNGDEDSENPHLVKGIFENFYSVKRS